MKLNHKKLTTLLNEFIYDVPGGIKTKSLPDFTRYYIQEAAKSFMGISHSDFDNGGTSKKNILKKVTPILAEYDLLDDMCTSYEVFLLNNKVENLLPESVLLNNNDYKLALEHINTANRLLKSVEEEYIKDRKTETDKNMYYVSEKYNIPLIDLKEIYKDLKK